MSGLVKDWMTQPFSHIEEGRALFLSQQFRVNLSLKFCSCCRLLGVMPRALGDRPGGLGRFLGHAIGGNHCHLRHIGWEQCVVMVHKRVCEHHLSLNFMVTMLDLSSNFLLER